jgi:hypothetical protein
MSIEPQIKQLIGKLNPKWFADLNDEFVKHPFYNKKTQFIDDVVQEHAWGYDPETGEVDDDVYDVVIQATLNEFAWRGEHYGYNYPEEEEEYLVFKAQSLTSKIFELTDPILKEVNDIKDKHNFIVSVVRYMVDAGEELKTQLNDGLYHDAIDYCIHRFRVEISDKYRSIKKAHDTIVEYEDRLYFDMSQKELAFLLAVLIRSGFIQGASAKNSTVYSFFSKYFYFKNQKADNTFQRANGINKKISDVFSPNNTDYQTIKEELKERLIQTIKEL